MANADAVRNQTLVGLGVLGLAIGLAWGAIPIPSDSGYAGIGPDFLPWLVAIALGICGVALVYEARHGGFRDLEDQGSEAAYWPGFVWMSTGLLLNAALITTLGFILSCTLCFTLACRGMRTSRGEAAGRSTWIRDAVTGLLISAPVYWMFTKFLAIHLPGLTKSGWL